MLGPEPIPLSRRVLIRLSATAGAALLAGAEVGAADAGEPVVDRLTRHFEDAGLPEPKVVRQGRFVAVTTARREFVLRVLRMAEDTAAGYARFVSGLKLPVRFENGPLALAMLANAGQYSRFIGEQKARNEGGHYDIDANWTVTFDHRGRSRSTRSDLERANQVTLIHEMTHHLSFETGLLSPDADVPMLVSEGLATLAEPSGAAILPGFSDVNRPRVAVMDQLLKSKRARWLSLSDLIATDALFDAPDDATLQLAYSQSWLFWDTVVRFTRLREKLGPYLQRVNGRRDDRHRLDDFVAVFGSMKSVEEAMAANWGDLV